MENSSCATKMRADDIASVKVDLADKTAEDESEESLRRSGPVISRINLEGCYLNHNC